MLRYWHRLFASLLLVAPAVPALAAAGTALGVDPAAEARGTTSRTLVVGADIFIGDRIVTDDNGLVQIVFSDRTRLVVGPRSDLLIEDYLLRDNGSAGAFAVNALSGTFRFITGGAPKDRYRITTPTGTIGVRGTAMDFSVETGQTATLQLHGASIYCPKGSPPDACRILDKVCHWGLMKSADFEILGHTDKLKGSGRDQAKAWFMLASSQSRLHRLFRVAGAERCLARPPPEGYVVPEDPPTSPRKGPPPDDNYPPNTNPPPGR